MMNVRKILLRDETMTEKQKELNDTQMIRNDTKEPLKCLCGEILFPQDFMGEKIVGKGAVG